MLVRCPELPVYADWEVLLAVDGSMPLGTFTREYLRLMENYNNCAIKLDCLIEAVEKQPTTTPICKSPKEGQ